MEVLPLSFEFVRLTKLFDVGITGEMSLCRGTNCDFVLLQSQLGSVLHEGTRMRQTEREKLGRKFPFPFASILFLYYKHAAGFLWLQQERKLRKLFSNRLARFATRGWLKEEGVVADNASRMRVELKGMRKGVVCVG